MNSRRHADAEFHATRRGAREPEFVEEERDELADTFTDLRVMVDVEESGDRIPNVSAIMRSQVRFAQIATEQIGALKSRCHKAEKLAEAAVKRTDVLYERVKWVWWVVGFHVATFGYCIKTAIEYRLAH